MPGAEVYDYNQLIDSINYINNNHDAYIQKYKSQSLNILNKFYNIDNTKSVDNIYKLINTIIHK